MPRLNELTYDIREAIKQYSDDTELDDRYIKYLYNTKRAKYLRQDLNNYHKAIDNSIQQSFCMDLEEVSSNQCSIAIAAETIMRTTLTIPKPLELHTKTAITRVKEPNRVAIPINFISKERVVLLEGAVYPNKIYAFLDVDNKIYLYSKAVDYKTITCLNITGIFENPLDLSTYTDCCSCALTVDNIAFNEETMDYPLQPHFIDLIRKEIIQDLVNLLQIPEDKDNNSND